MCSAMLICGVSKDVRHNLVRYHRLVLCVRRAVLERALLLVADGAVHEQHGEEGRVEERQRAVRADAGEQAPRPSGRELEEVLRVPRDAPPAGDEEQARVARELAALRVGDVVLGLDGDRLAAPHERRAARLAEALPLQVRLEIECDAEQPDGEDRAGGGPREAGRQLHHAPRMERVDGGHPDQAAPRLVEARPVGDDVDGAHVADLPVEELDEVDKLRRGAQDEARVEPAVPRVRRGGEGDAGEHPVGHRDAAVDEALHVDAAQLRVELRAPVVVEEQPLARRACVRAGGAEAEPAEALGVEQRAEGEPAKVEQPDRRAEVVVKH
mmetsp:Transcript_23888/g.77042  ORF Transcript_23888/g.77042 Transcript_23888/m.77042 type:complete len:326 (+) Transcript_23888:309-1286(+)